MSIVTFAFILQANRYYGTIGSSIYTMIMNWSLIFFDLMTGVGQAAQPLISLSYGEKAEKKEQRCLRYALMTSVLLGIIFFVVSYIFAEPLIHVFSDQDADLIAISVSCMRYYSCLFHHGHQHSPWHLFPSD